MLFKNVIRTLKRQYIQLLLLGVIIISSSFMYTGMDYSIKGVESPTSDYFEEANQEDFAMTLSYGFTNEEIAYMNDSCLLPGDQILALPQLRVIDYSCYQDIQNNRLQKIEDEFEHIHLELREYKDIYYDYGEYSYKVRVLKETESINQPFFVKGEGPSIDSEIAISESFAKANNLDVGDTLKIGDLEFVITGFVLFPDYSLAVLSADLILDNKTQTIALMTDNQFESLQEVTYYDVAGEYIGDYTDDEFERDVIETYSDNEEVEGFLKGAILTINNMRSGAIYAELAGGRAQSVGISLLISFIALMIVGIMVSKVLQKQRGPIGILKSMGYKNREIALPYILFIGLMALPTTLIGYFLGLYTAEPLKQVYLQFYLLPSQPIEQSVITFFISVLLPTIFILSVSYVLIIRMLSKKPVDLLNPQVSSNGNIFTRIASKYLKRFKVTTKLQHLLLYRSVVKFAVYLIGMSYAAFLILFSFSMFGIFDRLVFDYYENTDHDYIGYCESHLVCELPDGGEKVIEVQSVGLNNEEVTAVGLDVNNQLHRLLDKKGKDITSKLSEGIIINHSLQITNHLSVGDIVTIEVNNETIESEIVAITEEYSGDKFYINREVLALFAYDDSDAFNVVYSSAELEDDDFVFVLSTQAILKQAENMQEFTNVAVGIMIVISVGIGAIVIYILTTMTVEDNFYNISLFKVLGYNDKEIDRMVLGGYMFYGIGIFVITIPVAIIFFHIMVLFFVEFYDMLFPVQFIWWHGIVTVVIYVIIFYITGFIAKRNLKKVSLQEAMKMYQV